MKKTIFLILSIMFFAFTSNGETSGDTCVASNGVKFIVGQDITLGPGSGINGSYVWIHTAPGLTTPIYLPAGWAGYKMRIKEIREMGTKKRGYKKYLILGGGNIVNYWMDLEEGMVSGEIREPSLVKEKIEDKKESTISIADELAKLKKLMEDSVITKEEFEIEKTKLLSK